MTPLSPYKKCKGRKLDVDVTLHAGWSDIVFVLDTLTIVCHLVHRSTGPWSYPPTTRLIPRPWEPTGLRMGPGPSAHDHHTPPETSGTPAWGRTTAKPPPPPSCPGGHMVKSGACEHRTARVGYCLMFACLFMLYAREVQ